LYAARRFKKEEFVGVVRGRVIDDPEFGSNYGIGLGGTYTLEPSAPFRFLNHCCTPNCELLLVDAPPGSRRPDIPRVIVQARRIIRPGDELTIDYGWPAESAIECACGSRWCRGWIVAKSQRKRLPQVHELAAVGADVADVAAGIA
jgi:hypothetical protein